MRTLALLLLLTLAGCSAPPDQGAPPRVSHVAVIENVSAADALVQVRLDGSEACLVELGPGAHADCVAPYRSGNRTWVVAVDFGSGFTEYVLRTNVADPHFAVGRFSVSLSQ